MFPVTTIGTIKTIGAIGTMGAMGAIGAIGNNHAKVIEIDPCDQDEFPVTLMHR